MSSFLWVEDFEDKQYQQFSHSLFGSALNLSRGEFPNNELDLREFLLTYHIHLATNYAEGAKLIKTKLIDFDYFVIDIDLNIIGEDWQNGMLEAEPILRKWHGYLPEASDQEISLNSARDAMKMVAGYHLYVELVMRLGVANSRVLFASNHGDYLGSINRCFKPAMMDPPLIYTKNNSMGGQWVKKCRNDEYSVFRRGVILACESFKCDKRYFRPPQLNKRLSPNDGEVLLESLPLVLPPIVLDVEIKRHAFRLFARTITQNLDQNIFFQTKRGVADSGLPISREDRAFAAVIALIRNWTSHDANALAQLNERDIAFIFLISLRFLFNFEKDTILPYEYHIFPLLGDYKLLNMGELAADYQFTFDGLKSKWSKLTSEPPQSEEKYYSNMANDLQKNHKLISSDNGNELLRVFWHQLHWALNGVFSPLPKDFQNSLFLNELTARLYSKNFS